MRCTANTTEKKLPKFNTATKCTATSDARFPTPPDPELSKMTRFTAFPNMKYTGPLATNIQCSQSQTFNVPDRYSDQIRFCREWEEKMERLNNKYGLDCFSDSELHSESDEGEDYRYERKYETLI